MNVVNLVRGLLVGGALSCGLSAAAAEADLDKALKTQDKLLLVIQQAPEAIGVDTSGQPSIWTPYTHVTFTNPNTGRVVPTTGPLFAAEFLANALAAGMVDSSVEQHFQARQALRLAALNAAVPPAVAMNRLRESMAAALRTAGNRELFRAQLNPGLVDADAIRRMLGASNGVVMLVTMKPTLTVDKRALRVDADVKLSWFRGGRDYQLRKLDVLVYTRALETPYEPVAIRQLAADGGKRYLAMIDELGAALVEAVLAPSAPKGSDPVDLRFSTGPDYMTLPARVLLKRDDRVVFDQGNDGERTSYPVGGYR